MASKTVKVESGKENGIESAMKSLSFVAPSTKGQKSGAEKKEPVVMKEASSTKANNSVQINSSDDPESRDAEFKKYLKDLDRKIREKLKQNPLPPNLLVELNNHLEKLTENQMELNEDRSKQEQQLKAQCCQLVSLLQQFCPPPEVWKWPVWQQMSLQEQIKQTEQLKQLVEKYVVAVKYLIIEENMSMNMPQSLPPYKLSKVDYTSEAHINYVSKYCGEKKVLFLGINTSKKGMELGGVPFCDEESIIRNWLRVSDDANQNAPPSLNAKGSANSSGTRFWDLVKKICGTPDVFFQNCFVRNYCPLLFLDDSGKYVSLSGMNADDQQFEPSCDRALRECIQALGVEIVVAVGGYVTERAKKALDGSVKVVQILHPSGLSRLNGGFTDDNHYIQETRSVLQERGIIPYMKS